MMKKALLFVLLGAGIGVGLLYLYLSYFPTAIVEVENKEVLSQKTEKPLNPVAKAIEKMGDTACTERVNQVTNFLGFNENSGVLVMTTPNQVPNQHIIPLVMEQAMKDGTAFISATFAPNQSSGCEATYETHTIWNKPCQAVFEQEYRGFKIVGQLKKHIKILDGGTSMKIFLMQAGDMCVSVKKEIVE